MENERFEHLYRETEELRVAAYRAFDAGRHKHGEKLWASYLAKLPHLEHSMIGTAQQLESALSVANWRDDVREHLLDTLLRRALFAEQLGRGTFAIQEQIGRLKLYDGRGEHVARWEAPARLSVTSDPAGASVVLEQYTLKDGLATITSRESLGITPIPARSIPVGSYRLRFSIEGRPEVVYPILLARGETSEVAVPLPPRESLPEGFLFIPGGRVLYGSNASEDVRVSFISEPLHPVEVGPFLINRYEVTYRDYLIYLEALPAEERRALIEPHGRSDIPKLSELPGGGWQLDLYQGDRFYVAKSDEPLVYEGRSVRGSVEWEQLPVTGISAIEAQKYLAWLDRSRIPGARLCNEYEWERAARGADARAFPTGDRLDPDSANTRLTYGDVPAAFGPDPVGSYPQSESPFGVHDMAGNVYELTVHPHDEETIIIRGGAFFYTAYGAQIATRVDGPRDFRHFSGGFRVCATWPRPH